MVKASWIKTIPILNMYKHSINRNIPHIVFYSNDDEEADFSLDVSHQELDRGIYIGYLVAYFRKYEYSIKYNSVTNECNF